MPAYFGPWRVVSAQPVPPAVLALARKLVGSMLQVGGIPQRMWRLDDGTTIHALIVNGLPKVTIVQGGGAGEIEVETTQLWVPRGFVVYPAWSDAPGGVGLPIVPDPDRNAYDAVNLAPGMERARWTAGGPCGEVLLTTDDDAGYPTSRFAITVPLLYHPTLGPVFRWGGQTSYDARPTARGWAAYRMELAPPVARYADENVTNLTALFETINVYRTSGGYTALNLQPRGYYGPAQVMVSIMQAAGSTDATAPGYPPTYTTPADRLTKDGYSATLMAGAFASFERGDNPTAFELRAFGGSAATVFDAWQSDPDSNAILTQDIGAAAFADVGFRGGYWCADIISRSSWIAAGNACWQGSDRDIPPVSWMSFASVNLAWETYPATYDTNNATTAPLVPALAFTDANGDCWLNYPRTPAPTVADIEPGMSRHIYMRGRAIAMAPRGGLVWGASVIRNGEVDRLIALVHHPEDQLTDYTTNGWTRYLRVWWCDIPRRRGLRADPQQTICGEDPDDAWGWKGGDLIDVGHMPPPSTGGTVADGVTSSLKYASAWRFNADGTRAVCLRDYGIYTDYSLLYGVVGIQTRTGLFPRAVELTFVPFEHSTMVGVVWHDYTAGAFASDRAIARPLDTTDELGTPVYEHGVVPIAVDYAESAALVYAFTGEIASFNHVGDISYSYVGIGPAVTDYPSNLLYRRLHGMALKTPSSDFCHSGVVVADVPSAAFVLEGVRPRIDQATGEETGAPCFPFTDEPVHGVRMVQRGQLLDERWYPAPDGAVFSLATVCDSNVGSSAVMVELPLATSRNVQTSLVQRFGQQVFCTQVAPVPLALRVLDAPPSDANCGCRLDIRRVADASHWMAYDEFNPRGGHAIASVPLPDHDWLIYAKAV